MSFTWAEARRQVRDPAVKDFPCTMQVRNLYTVDSPVKDKDLKSWQAAFGGCQGARTASQNPLAPPANRTALNSHQPFLGQRLTSELELSFLYEGRIPSC